MSLHIASVEFFEQMTDEQKQTFAQGFYDTVDFDDRKKEISWGSPWVHGHFDDNVNFMGNDPYNWGIQYAIQMKMRNWYGQADKSKNS